VEQVEDVRELGCGEPAPRGAGGSRAWLLPRAPPSRPGRYGVLPLRTAAWWKKSIGVELHLEEGS